MLSKKQNEMIIALMEEPTITKAADRLGISRTAIYKNMEKEEFRKELQKRQSECVDASVRYLQGKMESVNTELIRIIENPNTAAQIKVNAINAFYQNLKQMYDMTTTESALEKLKTIEKALGEKT